MQEDPYSDMVINLNEDENSWVTFVIQTRALLWKNYLLFRRKTRALLFMTMAPVVIGYFLTLIQGIGDSLKNTGVVDGRRFKIGDIPFCNEHENFHPMNEEECISIGYGIIGPSDSVFDDRYEKYHDIMRILAVNSGFEYGKDVKPFDFVYHNSVENYIDSH